MITFMDDLTQKYYSERVSDTFDLYDTAKTEGVSRYFNMAFQPGGRVLDIGAGSGIDLGRLLDSGYDAFGIDASPDMVSLAVKRQPRLAARFVQGSVPSDSPFFGGGFDGILCCAMFMHVPGELLLDTAYAIKRNLKTGGRLLLSVPVERPDVDKEGRIPDGRLFIMRPAEYYSLLFQRLGFRSIFTKIEDDSLGRPGVRWSVQIFELDTDNVHSLDRIESIINRDNKTAT